MPGESPLSMMYPPGQRVRRPAAQAARRPLLLLPLLLAAAVVIALALAWVWLWYHAAGLVNNSLSLWVDREAAAGRVYSCGSQTVGGFPFRIEARCADAAASLTTTQPPYVVRAKDLVIAAQVYHPNVLIGDLTGPLSLAEGDQPPDFIANWSRARVIVQGLPPAPESASVTLDLPRLDRAAGATVFQADHADLESRIIGGSARDRPVIEAVFHLKAAAAPTLHPALANKTEAQVDAVFTGFKDLSPKPWAERFREMQATGGKIEIKFLRLAQSDAMIIVGTGTLTVNAHGKLDGLIRVGIAGIEGIVPMLGVDKAIGKGINRLTGVEGPALQGLGALDRLVPGLSDAVRESANASIIESLKKMGQPTAIDKKPAIALPLRISDGAVYLGMIPLGEVPPLF